jgi:hypothetical protein
VSSYFIYVNNWCNTECNDTSFAAKCSNVTMYTNINVLANEGCALGVGGVFLKVTYEIKVKLK